MLTRLVDFTLTLHKIDHHYHIVARSLIAPKIQYRIAYHQQIK